MIADPQFALHLGFWTITGACVGSFAGAAIYRLPRECASLLRPRRSFCPGCRKAIPWHDNIPVLAWLLLRGRARCCGMAISPRYPLVEALTAVLFFAIGRTLAPALGWGAAVALSLLAAALLIALYIDLDFRIIPDEITVYGMLLAPPLSLFLPRLHDRKTLDFSGLPDLHFLAEKSAWLQDISSTGARIAAVAGLAVLGFGLLQLLAWAHFYVYLRIRDLRWTDLIPHGLAGASGALAVLLPGAFPELVGHPGLRAAVASLLGMLAGGGLLYFVGVAGKIVFGRDAMGLGDAKLVALLGGFLGWAVLPAVFLGACVVGSVAGLIRLWRTGDRLIAFGPYLALLGISAIFFRDEMVDFLVRIYLPWLR